MSRNLAELSNRRQVSIWLTEEDIDFLHDLAEQREQSVSALLRRAIATWRRDRANRGDRTNVVPDR